MSSRANSDPSIGELGHAIEGIETAVSIFESDPKTPEGNFRLRVLDDILELLYQRLEENGNSQIEGFKFTGKTFEVIDAAMLWALVRSVHSLEIVMIAEQVGAPDSYGVTSVYCFVCKRPTLSNSFICRSCESVLVGHLDRIENALHEHEREESKPEPSSEPGMTTAQDPKDWVSGDLPVELVVVEERTMVETTVLYTCPTCWGPSRVDGRCERCEKIYNGHKTT